MFDINLHPLPGTKEVSGHVMVCGQCHTCCCCRSLNMCMTSSVVQTNHLFFFVVCISLFFRVLCWWFLVLWSVRKYLVSYYRVISKFFRLQKVTSIDKIPLLMKMLLVMECVTSLVQTVVMGVMSMRSEWNAQTSAKGQNCSSTPRISPWMLKIVD